MGWLLSSLMSLVRQFKGATIARRPVVADPPAIFPKELRLIERVVVTDQVYETLFNDFAAHRDTERGEEEIGWVILGLRHESHVVVLAALPAGAQREASLTHVFFNSDAQAPATRFLRQADKRLIILGVVHTHPGSLRHPSGGDYQGDIRWVRQLRGKEGVFGIGTADARTDHREVTRIEPHQHVRGPLLFNWYVLAEDDSRYRRVNVEIALGPDLARPLQPLWSTLEHHARGIDRLWQQQTGVKMEILGEGEEQALAFTISMPSRKRSIRVLLNEGSSRYYLEEDGGLFEIDPDAENLEQGVYLILAKLAQRDG